MKQVQLMENSQSTISVLCSSYIVSAIFNLFSIIENLLPHHYKTKYYKSDFNEFWRPGELSREISLSSSHFSRQGRTKLVLVFIEVSLRKSDINFRYTFSLECHFTSDCRGCQTFLQIKSAAVSVFLHSKVI